MAKNNKLSACYGSGIEFRLRNEFEMSFCRAGDLRKSRFADMRRDKNIHIVDTTQRLKYCLNVRLHYVCSYEYAVCNMHETLLCLFNVKQQRSQLISRADAVLFFSLSFGLSMICFPFAFVCRSSFFFSISIL